MGILQIVTSLLIYFRTPVVWLQWVCSYELNRVVKIFNVVMMLVTVSYSSQISTNDALALVPLATISNVLSLVISRD